MDVSIIIVNWNSQEHLKKCVASIVEHTRTVSYEIIVIDSASFDGCDQMLAKHYPQVRFIQGAENLGFARSNNRAFEESVGDCVLFLNPDTEVEGLAIDRLCTALHSVPACGIVGARLLNSDGSVQASCIQSLPTILNKSLDSEFLRSRWPKSALWGVAALYEHGSKAQAVEAISGACMLLRREVFAEVGGFSDDYFMYAEDIDLSHKVMQSGYTNYFVPHAIVIHHGGSSSQQAATTFSTVMQPEATWRFLRKTRGPAYGLGFRVSMCASAVGRLLLLGLTAPFWMRGNERTSGIASCRKWLAILRWGLNRDDLTKQYYPIASGGQSYQR